MKYISEKPSKKDLFQGAHNKIAETLQRIITSEKSVDDPIALIGNLGAGKSTVIELLKDKLSLDNYVFFTFDCFRHNNGPMRHAFIEELYQELNENCEVSRKGELKDIMYKAIGRSSIIKKKNDITIPNEAMYFALSIPISAGAISAFLKLSSSSYFTTSPDVSLTSSIVLSFILSITPIGIAFKAYKKWKKDNPDEKWSFGKLLHTNNDLDVTETQVLTNELTSFELKRYYQEMIDFLPEEKKLIIVIDNIDRITYDKMIEIWSDLDDFLLHNSEKTFVIAPFSKNEIKEAFKTQFKNAKESSKRTDYLSQEFIIKRFPIRFNVPTVLPHDWKKYFAKQWKSIFEHEPENKLEDVIQMFRSVYQNEVFTPRFINNFINDLSALKESSTEEPDIRIFSAYLLFLGTLPDPNPGNLIEKVRAMDSEENLTTLNVLNASSSDWQKELLSIHFNVPVNKVEELLIIEPLSIELSKGDVKSILKKIDINGFNNSLAKAVDLLNTEQLQPAFLSLISCSCFYEDHTVKRVMKELTQKITTWKPTSKLSEEIDSIYAHFTDDQSILNGIANSIVSEDIETAKELLVLDNIAKHFVLEEYIRIGNELFVDEFLENKKYVHLTTNDFMANEMHSHLSYCLSSETMSLNKILAILKRMKSGTLEKSKNYFSENDLFPTNLSQNFSIAELLQFCFYASQDDWNASEHLLRNRPGYSWMDDKDKPLAAALLFVASGLFSSQDTYHHSGLEDYLTTAKLEQLIVYFHKSRGSFKTLLQSASSVDNSNYYNAIIFAVNEKSFNTLHIMDVMNKFELIKTAYDTNTEEFKAFIIWFNGWLKHIKEKLNSQKSNHFEDVHPSFFNIMSKFKDTEIGAFLYGIAVDYWVSKEITSDEYSKKIQALNGTTKALFKYLEPSISSNTSLQNYIKDTIESSIAKEEKPNEVLFSLHRLLNQQHQGILSRKLSKFALKRCSEQNGINVFSFIPLDFIKNIRPTNYDEAHGIQIIIESFLDNKEQEHKEWLLNIISTINDAKWDEYPEIQSHIKSLLEELPENSELKNLINI